MSESEETHKKADIQSGMIMRVLDQNPFDEGQSAILHPGMQEEFPEVYVFVVNRSDFQLFADMIFKHNMRLSYIRQDQNNNALYAIEEGAVKLDS